MWNCSVHSFQPTTESWFDVSRLQGTARLIALGNSPHSTTVDHTLRIEFKPSKSNYHIPSWNENCFPSPAKRLVKLFRFPDLLFEFLWMKEILYTLVGKKLRKILKILCKTILSKCKLRSCRALEGNFGGFRFGWGFLLKSLEQTDEEFLVVL